MTTTNELHDAIYNLRIEAAKAAGCWPAAGADIHYGELGNPDLDFSATIDGDTITVWAAGDRVATSSVPA